MNTEERIGKLLEAFKNNTKMKIIFLLAENERMTVTQMSKSAEISKTNLYHFVEQLVEEGILNQPEVVAKKNYLEKYYALNSELFGATRWDELEEHFASMGPEEVRSLLREFLIGQAFNLQMLAEKAKKASDDQIEKFKNAMLNQSAFMGYAISHIDEHPNFTEILEKVQEEFSQINPEKKGREGDVVRSLILVIPYL